MKSLGIVGRNDKILRKIEHIPRDHKMRQWDQGKDHVRVLVYDGNGLRHTQTVRCDRIKVGENNQ